MPPMQPALRELNRRLLRVHVPTHGSGCCSLRLGQALRRVGLSASQVLLQALVQQVWLTHLHLTSIQKRSRAVCASTENGLDSCMESVFEAGQVRAVQLPTDQVTLAVCMNFSAKPGEAWQNSIALQQSTCTFLLRISVCNEQALAHSNLADLLTASNGVTHASHRHSQSPSSYGEVEGLGLSREELPVSPDDLIGLHATNAQEPTVSTLPQFLIKGFPGKTVRPNTVLLQPKVSSHTATTKPVETRSLTWAISTRETLASHAILAGRTQEASWSWARLLLFAYHRCCHFGSSSLLFFTSLLLGPIRSSLLDDVQPLPKQEGPNHESSARRQRTMGPSV